ncbi:MAG: hypothetical protein JW920_07700 [Deltaproteobacteria bacterium]|nr:hypothetical protein [Deltaproteobacteria bacterium]
MPRPRKPVDIEQLKRNAVQAKANYDQANAQMVSLQNNQEDARSKLSGLRMVVDECKKDLDHAFERHAMGEITKEQLADAKRKHRDAEKNLKHHEDLINACIRAQGLVSTKIQQAVNIRNGCQRMLHNAVFDEIKAQTLGDDHIVQLLNRYHAAACMAGAFQENVFNSPLAGLLEIPKPEEVKALQENIRAEYGITKL